MSSPSYEQDIFVSYAEIDNQPFAGLENGWVTLLVESLNQYIPMRSGRVVKIWAHYRNLQANIPIQKQIQQQINSSATFLIVLSNGYLQDKQTKFELETILKQATLQSGRIFVLEKGEVKRPRALKHVQGYTFWERDSRDRVKIFGFPDPSHDSRFFSEVQHLADDFAEALQGYPSTIISNAPEENLPEHSANPTQTINITGNVSGSVISLGNETSIGQNHTQTTSSSSTSEPAYQPNITVSSSNSEQETDNIESAYFLHLSDLHFGNENDAENWYLQLHQDLKLNLHFLEKKQLHGVIISGDIANFAAPEEYQAAKLFLDKLRTNYALSPDQLVIVPGNHDVNWGVARKAYRGANKKLNLANHIKRFEDFQKFYQEVKNRPYWLEYERQSTLDEFAEHKILFAGFNSAYQLDHTNTENAEINGKAFNQVIEEVMNNDHYKDYLKIAVWHHPLNSATPDRIKNQDFLEQLAVIGFKIILHGHIHKSESSLYTYDVIAPASGRNLRTVSAGTFGAPPKEWADGHPLQYNLLERQADKLIVHTRCREKVGGAWRADPRWHGRTKEGEEIYRAHYEIPL